MTVWFSDGAVAAWAAEPRTTPGGQPWCSALAIAAALTLRAVFRLAPRRTEGLVGSILRLLGLGLPVPGRSALSRRAGTLRVPRPRAGKEPAHLLVDGAGPRLCGPGERLSERHGSRKRRSWGKPHLATGADTGRIVAAESTGHDADDGPRVGPSPDRMGGAVASCTADGAHGRDRADAARPA